MLPDEETLEETRKEGLEMAEYLVYEFPVIRVINPNEYEIEIYGQDTLTYSRGKGIKIGTKSTTKSTQKETPKTTDKKTALGNKLRKGMVVRIEYKESNGSTLSYDLFYDNGDFIEYVLIINKKGEELVEAEEIITEKELNEKYTELSEFIIAEFYETKEDGGELMASGGQMELFVGGGRAVRPSMFEIYQVKDKMGRVAYFTDKDLQKFLNDWNEDYDTDYEDWIEFNEYEREFIIKPIFSKNEMGGDVSYSNEPIAVFRFQDLEDKTESLMSDVDTIEFLNDWNRDMQTNYSDWRDFNKGEEYYRITPVFSSNEMGGGVNFEETQINDIANWENEEIANYLDLSTEEVANNRKKYVRLAQNELMLSGVDSYAMGGTMDVVIASSPTLEGIKKLISEYLYGSTITLVQIDDDGEFFEVHNKKGITPFYVKLKNNKYQFVPSQDNFKNGGSLKKKSNDLGEYYDKYVNGGFVGGDIIKFKYDGKDFTRKVESVDEMGNALVNLMKSEKATINPADIFDIKKEFTEKDVIIKKIGFNEALAEYLISVSPTFAVWLADSILENEIEERQESKEVVLKAINEKSISKNTNYLNNNFGGAIREILDWLQHPSTPKQNLRELTFKEALEKARAWHQELTTSGGDLNFTEPKENIVIKQYAPNQFGKTYYWVFIPKSYCDIESARMGHCGRTGAGSLISLRSVFKNTNEDTISDSHVTIAYNYEEGKFYQAKGKQNKKPVEKYFPYIFDLIQLLANGEIQKQYELNNEEKLKEIKEYDKKIKEIDEKVSKHIRNGLGFTQNGDVYFRSENNLLGYEIEDKQYADKFLGKNFKKNILEDITRYLDDNAYINDFNYKYAKLQELQNNVRNNREFEGYELAKEKLVEDYFNWYLENISYPYKEYKQLKEDRYYLQLGMDDYNFDFNGFESEYQASNDYGWEDMTNKQIKELYELKPELFNDFAGQYMLYKIGMIDEEPNTKVTIEKSVGYVADLLSIDRDLSDDFVEKVLTNDTYEWFDGSDSWSYFYDNAGDYVDDLNKEDYDAVLDKIVEITGLDKQIVEENGAKHYLDGDDEEFDSDNFEDIKRAITSPLEGTERSSYENYYFDTIKEALGELGVIKNLDDTGVEIEVDLKDLIGISAISGYMKNLDSENLEDVFFEAESNGDFSLPDLSIDDRYSGDTYNWQDYFDINNYAVGGAVYPDLSMQKPQVVNDSIQLAEFELKQAKELTTINNIKNKQILSSDDAVDIFRQIWEKDTISAYEQAYVLFVNTNNKPKGFYHHSSGGIDGTIMDIQMISGMAVKSLSKGVIIAHNHPSGNTQPSEADKKITEQMKQALQLFNIKLLDSLILTENNYLSFANMGIL